MKRMVLTTRSAESTEALGREVAAFLGPGTVVALEGDLGAGKTVFSRGIARGLGVDEPVTSPTFTVVQEYPLAAGRWLYHLDMYRIDSEESALAFGIEEFLFSPAAVSLVEWPQRIAGLLSDANTIWIGLEHVDGTTRRICLPCELVPADWNAGGTP